MVVHFVITQNQFGPQSIKLHFTPNKLNSLNKFQSFEDKAECYHSEWKMTKKEATAFCQTLNDDDNEDYEKSRWNLKRFLTTVDE